MVNGELSARGARPAIASHRTTKLGGALLAQMAESSEREIGGQPEKHSQAATDKLADLGVTRTHSSRQHSAYRLGTPLLGINLIASGGAGAYSDDRRASPRPRPSEGQIRRLTACQGRSAFQLSRRNPLHGPAIRATFRRDGHPFLLDLFQSGLLVGDTGVVGLGPIFWESACNGAATDGF
jgi:hypothetical protein